ncbi:MAG: hypothetical protein V4479_00875 [Actinomycetota bacterium]
MTGNRLWTVGAIVATIAVALLGWFVAISPVLTLASASETQAQGIEAQNSASDASITALAAEFTTLPEKIKELAALQSAAPESADLDDFLDQLQNLATANGATITSFTAAEAVAYGGSANAVPATTPTPGATAGASTGAAGPAAVTGGSLAGKLFTVPITIALTGNADQVIAFSKAAQLGARFFLVTSVSFTGGSQAGGTLTGYVFVVREPSATGSDSATPSPNATPTPTATPSATPTATPGPGATATSSPAVTPTPTATPTH